VPEGDTIFRAATVLRRALAGRTITELTLIAPKASLAASRRTIVGGTVKAVESNGKHLLTFAREEADAERTHGALARALAAEVGPDGQRTLFIETVDGSPVDETPIAEALRDAGFARTPRGYLRRVSRA